MSGGRRAVTPDCHSSNNSLNNTSSSILQRHTAVTAYLKSKQLLLFAFASRSTIFSTCCCRICSTGNCSSRRNGSSRNDSITILYWTEHISLVHKTIQFFLIKNDIDLLHSLPSHQNKSQLNILHWFVGLYVGDLGIN